MPSLVAGAFPEATPCSKPSAPSTTYPTGIQTPTLAPRAQIAGPMNSLRATALLNRNSRDANTKVTRSAQTRSTIGSSDSCRACNSLKYRR